MMLKFETLIKEENKNFIMPTTWYHFTSLKNAESIMQNGFSLNTKESSPINYNLYGKSIWFANPAHIWDDRGMRLIQIELTNDFNIANLIGEDNWVNFKKKLLTIPEVQKSARDYASDQSDEFKKDVEQWIKEGTAHFDDKAWKFGTIKLGYDGMIFDKDEPGFYQGLWLCIYNVDKLNRLPRKIVKIPKQKQQGYH